MAKGSVVSIQIAKDAKGGMESLQEVQAVEGKGLEGDRYCNQVGSYSHNPGPDREVTLIEAEALEAMARAEGNQTLLERDYGTTLDPKDSRRNITTRGVPLNHLLQGREFTIGDREDAGAARLRALRQPRQADGQERAAGARAPGRPARPGTQQRHDTRGRHRGMGYGRRLCA